MFRYFKVILLLCMLLSQNCYSIDYPIYQTSDVIMNSKRLNRTHKIGGYYNTNSFNLITTESPSVPLISTSYQNKAWKGNITPINTPNVSNVNMRRVDFNDSPLDPFETPIENGCLFLFIICCVLVCYKMIGCFRPNLTSK